MQRFPVGDLWGHRGVFGVAGNMVHEVEARLGLVSGMARNDTEIS